MIVLLAGSLNALSATDNVSRSPSRRFGSNLICVKSSLLNSMDKMVLISLNEVTIPSLKVTEVVSETSVIPENRTSSGKMGSSNSILISPVLRSNKLNPITIGLIVSAP